MFSYDWIRMEFFLKHFVIIILLFYFLFSISAYILDLINILEFDNINNLLIKKFLINREGILVSIAAIFIGIYFSIFTLLLTMKGNSKLVKMGEKFYDELVGYLINAFVGAFIYIIYAILYPLISYFNANSFIKFIIEDTLGALVLYMILSAFRVGLAFIIIFKSDKNNVFKNIEKENDESENFKDIIYKLGFYLDKVEKVEASKKAEEENDMIRFRNPKNTK